MVTNHSQSLAPFALFLFSPPPFSLSFNFLSEVSSKIFFAKKVEQGARRPIECLGWKYYFCFSETKSMLMEPVPIS